MSPTIAYLRSNPPDCKIYSNGPDILWLQAEIHAIQLTPSTLVLMPDRTFCFVWFEGVNRTYTMSLEALQKSANVETIEALKGGGVYFVTKR